MKTKIYIILLTGLALAVHSFAQDNAASQQEALEAASIVKVGDEAPDFTVEMLDGKPFKLSDAKGKVVLLNFWATWCSYCMQEFNVIPEKILKRFEGKTDFIFLPVSREESRETVRKKMIQLKESGIHFPVGLDPGRKIYDMYAKNYIPRNYIIDKDGKIVYATIGFNREEFVKLVDKIAELLK